MVCEGSWSESVHCVDTGIIIGLIPVEHWSVPSWIDDEKAAMERKKMEENDILYGGSLAYRHMCR